MNRAAFKLIALTLTILSCSDGRRYHDQRNEEPLPDNPRTAATVKHRRDLDALFRDPATSPLTDKQRARFSGLFYFEPDTNYIVRAELERDRSGDTLIMATTTERSVMYIDYGTLRFPLEGEMRELVVFRDPDPVSADQVLFIPFSDATSGIETYGGGRYLGLPIPEGQFVELDFNRAYNPYCAYDVRFSCPLVPRSNALEAAVRAGEKKFRK